MALLMKLHGELVVRLAIRNCLATPRQFWFRCSPTKSHLDMTFHWLLFCRGAESGGSQAPTGVPAAPEQQRLCRPFMQSPNGCACRPSSPRGLCQGARGGGCLPVACKHRCEPHGDSKMPMPVACSSRCPMIAHRLPGSAHERWFSYLKGFSFTAACHSLVCPWSTLRVPK